MRIGVYPGTFDPITNGHLDIIKRASQHMVDKLIVGVAEDTAKKTIFDTQERKALVEREILTLPQSSQDKIVVTDFSGLLINFVRKCGAEIIVRGLRAVSDFEYEFQMVGMNAKMAPDIETVFLMASEKQQFISSRFVKEIYRLGGDVSAFVSPQVMNELKQKNYG